VARRRREPPKTPLGAWLGTWLGNHPEWTHQALADDIGVSKGLISQWTSGAVKNVTATNLRGLARVTGEPLENLEQLVYGASAARVREERGLYFTEAELEALLARAAERAVRQVLGEMAEGRGE
jgi:transcriptional regulator with XRE-family HTH domain